MTMNNIYRLEVDLNDLGRMARGGLSTFFKTAERITPHGGWPTFFEETERPTPHLTEGDASL
jgi:hypothetical protein